MASSPDFTDLSAYTAPTRNPPTLLSLPRELRDEIYGHCIAAKEVYLSSDYCHLDKSWEISHYPEGALIFVNWQIHCEYLEFVKAHLRQAKAVVHLNPSRLILRPQLLSAQFYKILPLLKNIKRLSIRIHAEDYFPSFLDHHCAELVEKLDNLQMIKVVGSTSMYSRMTTDILLSEIRAFLEYRPEKVLERKPFRRFQKAIDHPRHGILVQKTEEYRECGAIKITADLHPTECPERWIQEMEIYG